ncbi:pyridoxal phosphate-dependent decarboxylase family protein [Psychroflexus planctonicus]|uniref:L-2,4-diaminobutyrate decarboxylase n=1 Tax=Psychroflexus planctonicus TaxID=1526575 RepID=A0ABQ1SK56_9FLAO|nr:aminotransferase class V-fold PLP-dependent enzyme [Psychroflexus planctonicus]GGE43931.1 L-2,4-diaminobutyrate decarboxylase [Psychroflexus planctonicus]
MQEDLRLFHQIAEKLFQEEENNPVVKPIPADQVYDEFNLHLNEEGISQDEFAELIEKVVLNTPRTSSKLFFNQLFGGRNTKATLGELLAVLLNTSMYTYKVGGPQVGIEKAILQEICKLINYPENAGGTFAPGGSMSNFMALLMARDVADQHIKKEGVSKKMTLYTSAESHYSTQKNASFAGIGTQQIRNIATDELGKMIPAEFEKQVQQDIANGYTPFFVNITAGTTVLGAFDEIKALDKIAKKYKIWSHVDGAYCGAVLFSEKYKHLIKGVENVDSFSFNAHKMLNTPLSSSIIVTKNRFNLHHSFACDANYLYQTDGDDFNLGKTSLQCGRRNDALKFWSLWKSVGTKGLEKMVDHQFDLAETARNYIKNNEDYTLYSYDESVSVCFNYKDLDPKVLCNLLYEEAKLMVGYGNFKGTDFVRLVTINSNNSDEEIVNFFKVLEKFAVQLEAEQV